MLGACGQAKGIDASPIAPRTPEPRPLGAVARAPPLTHCEFASSESKRDEFYTRSRSRSAKTLGGFCTSRSASYAYVHHGFCCA